MRSRFFEEKSAVIQRQNNIKHHNKHLEYVLSILGELFELSDYYVKETRKFTIENRDCRLAIHEVLEKSQKMVEHIAQLLDIQTVDDKDHDGNVQNYWLELYNQIEEMENNIKSAPFFNICSNQDRQLTKRVFKLLKNGCMEIPHTYLSQHSYAQRSFHQFLTRIGELATEKPTCFICYPWAKDSRYNVWIKRFVRDLSMAGVKVIFDISQNSFGKISDFTNLINKADYVVIIGCHELLWKWKNPEGRIVSKELNIIKELVGKDDHKIIKVLYSGNPNGLDSFPDFLHDYSHSATDFNNPAKYYDRIFNLLNKLYEKDKKLSGYVLLAKDHFMLKNKFVSLQRDELDFLNLGLSLAKESKNDEKSIGHSHAPPSAAIAIKSKL